MSSTVKRGRDHQLICWPTLLLRAWSGRLVCAGMAHTHTFDRAFCIISLHLVCTHTQSVYGTVSQSAEWKARKKPEICSFRSSTESTTQTLLACWVSGLKEKPNQTNMGIKTLFENIFRSSVHLPHNWFPPDGRMASGPVNVSTDTPLSAWSYESGCVFLSHLGIIQVYSEFLTVCCMLEQHHLLFTPLDALNVHLMVVVWGIWCSLLFEKKLAIFSLCVWMKRSVWVGQKQDQTSAFET